MWVKLWERPTLFGGNAGLLNGDKHLLKHYVGHSIRQNGSAKDICSNFVDVSYRK